MTNKTLQQIQEENRKIIGKPLTLNRVLIAVQDATYIADEIQFNGQYLCFIYLNIEWEWDLTKETLEEQSEETQREINKLLNNE